MVKFFSQSYLYDDPWALVTLAFFLRYPNPMAGHVVSCDVISRNITPSGSLLTTRLILKQGSLPKWFPRGMMSQAESWVIEESEVDVQGKVLRCKTKNLDHVKVMQVVESVELKEAEYGTKTLQKTEARFFSRFGWGLAKRIEKYGLTKFKTNIEKSREGISLVLRLLRESRPNLLTTPHLAYATATGTGTIFDSDLLQRNRLQAYTHHAVAAIGEDNAHPFGGASATNPISLHHADSASSSDSDISPSVQRASNGSSTNKGPGIWSHLKSYMRFSR